MFTITIISSSSSSIIDSCIVSSSSSSSVIIMHATLMTISIMIVRKVNVRYDD